ncbi:MAG: NFACT family protein [Candidatus Micrarchaeota archaeon]
MQIIEYSYIVRELAQLEGKHFSKIYKMDENSFRLKIGDSHVMIKLPFSVGIAKYITEGKELDNFTEAIKKILHNQKLQKICQCGRDRILSFEFKYNILFLEMFANGNIILTDKNKKILKVFREEKWRERTIAKGLEYIIPQSGIVENIENTLCKKYIVVCLLKLPLGKEYIKEMLARCGIEEKKPGVSLTKNEICCLEKEFVDIANNQKSYLFLENGTPVDFGLIKFKKYEKLETKEMPSLSEAMEEFYTTMSKTQKNEEMQKLERRLKEQELRLEELKKEEFENNGAGDYLYANYQKIEELLEIAKKAGINNLDFALKNYKISKINKEKKEIELDL